MAETRYKLVSDLIDLICEIDGVPIPSVTSIEYTHEVNAGRTVSISMANLDQRQVARLGAIITLKVGQNDVTQDDSHNLDFTGIIVQASPSIQTTTVVAIDYITFLQTSEYIEYKNSDIVGQDLYFLAADACNYKNIDTSILLKGSGIMATEAMELDGLQTRRQFLDKCFENMEVFLDDSEHNQVAVGVWRYAIKRNRVMDFWFEDPTNKKYQTAIMSISEKSPNLIGDGLITNIDITQIVNSATYHNNTDSSIYATVTDNDSVRRYGIRSKLFPSSLDEKGKLEMLAYQVVTRFKEPTFDYEITLKDAEHITVGDYIKIKNIAYEKEETLPVVKVFHSFTDTIVSKITVGNPERSLKDYIEIGLS
tara:strand:- start:385 stop:1482 length:1098 start_codon:yes stop_codon:yes gene_type:complete